MLKRVQGCLWYALYRSEYWYVKYIRYPFLLWRKIERIVFQKNCFSSIYNNCSKTYTKSFLALEKYGFGKEFILWVKTLLKDQETCVINDGTTTKYFSLVRGARKGNPIPAFLFILALEILFILIKSKPEIKNDNFRLWLPLVCICWWYNFFLEGYYFCKAYGWHFSFFSYFSGLKPNLTKSEIAGIGVLKGVQVAVCDMRCIDLNVDALKILGAHFSCNEKLKEEKKFYKIVTDMQRVLKIWKMRMLTLEWKIVIFKTIAISKMV